ncbi:MAG: transglutaminase family protein, partial [Chromatiaceae bacterium]
CALLRTLGRRYRGEDQLRWSYGVLARRDGDLLWNGPRDPLAGGEPADAAAVDCLAAALAAGHVGLGWRGFSFPGNAPQEVRVLLRLDGAEPESRPETDERLGRPSVHGVRTADELPSDPLAAEGQYLLIVCLAEDAGAQFVSLELPAASDVDCFLSLLGLIERAALAAELRGLILRGFPPAVDARLRWSTVTPDPGVIEVNQAPAAGVCELLAENRRLFAVAPDEGLSPFRLHYNGLVDDSGGGGQMSIGGPSPDVSPFVMVPQLLPRLVRYLNRHPSLSFWFSPVYVGAYSQAPRPDEGISDLFNELAVTLEQLAAGTSPDAELLWRSLSPFLCDVSGNTHRSELNIEKLWTASPRADGIGGVVEFRAFRMARTPERLAALAALIRSLIARLMTSPFEAPLVQWGETLHDRFALPFYLEQDLDAVLADLDAGGFAVGPVTKALLRSDGGRCIARWSSGDGCSLSLFTALEFWPQVGDTLNQPADSRLVDASTVRLEVRVEGGAAGASNWSLAVNGYALPMRAEQGRGGEVRVFGIRYRRFSSSHALHPGIEPRLPVRIQLYNSTTRELVDVEYYEWRPDGGAYSGLPEDEAEARRRREARVIRRSIRGASPPLTQPPPSSCLTDCCFDLRRILR